jgi:hypothetical protein
MAIITNVGAEVSEVPFGEFLRQVAQGIADGQRALDLTSVQTLNTLATTPVQIIPEITEVVSGEDIEIEVSGQAPVHVTGARVTGTPSDPVTMSALQAGILPTFYQFSNATILLKMSVQLRQVEEQDENGTTGQAILAFSSHVNFRTQNTFTYNAEASSSVTAVLVPVPPPGRVVPSTIMVNALGPTPSVTVSS